MLLFGERHSVYVWFALVLMFVGIAMIARKGVGTICAGDRSYFGRRHKTVFKPTESNEKIRVASSPPPREDGLRISRIR